MSVLGSGSGIDHFVTDQGGDVGKISWYSELSS
jgi:hypothetical protein